MPLVFGPPARLFDRFAGNPAVLSAETTSSIRLLVEGGESPHTVNGPEPARMPAFAPKLTDPEMAQVLTFVRESWGNAAAPVMTRQVDTLRAQLHR